MTPQGIHQVHVHVKKGEKAQGSRRRTYSTPLFALTYNSPAGYAPLTMYIYVCI